MTDREKLVKLLEDAPTDPMGNRNVGVIANHLLAHGVTILPYKVGDAIYYIDEDTHSIGTDTVKFLTVTKNGVRPILNGHNTWFWKDHVWGQNVFLSLEEAENALSSRGSGSCHGDPK